MNPSTASKIKSLSELKTIVANEKSRGRKIVFANGCFDLLHVGHIRYLNEAKSQGDILIVGLNSDDSVCRLKGDGRPILDQKGRAILLSALQAVDYVIIFEDDTVDRLLIELKPHFHSKGSEYSTDTVPEKETVKSYGGTTSITGGEKIQSTRWLFEEIRRRYSS